MLLLVTASLSLASEKPSPGTSNLANAAHPSLRIYDDRDGLPQNTAKSIAIDREGYLWVGTQDGAAYYNGRVWRTVNMPTRTASNWVTTICTASDGSILFGTNGAGICVLRHGDWTVLDRSNSPFNDGFIYQILESTPVTSPPTFWIAGGAGLFRLEGDRVLSADAPAGTLHGDVSAVLETVDPQGTRELWVGDDNGLVRRRNGSWESFIGSSGYPGTGTYCLSAGIDERGARVVWAGTMAGVARFASDRWTTVGTDPSESEPGVTHIFSIVTTHDPEILWVGSPAGLFHYEDGHWRKDSIATGLPDNSVVSLLELPAELGVRAVLAGTLSGGLVRLSLDGWRSVTDKSGLPDNHVYAFLEDTSSSGEAMFVGTYGGLARVAGDGTTVFRVGSGLPEDRVNCLLRTEDAVCVGTFGGIAILRNGAWSVVDSRSGLPDDGVRSLLETTSSGGAPILWAGTDRGLARRENGRWTVVDMSNGLPNNQVMALARTTARDGTESVWAGTLGGGLARLTGGHWTIVDATSGLPNDMVRCIREIDADGTRTLWVGTLGGAATLDLDDESAGWHIVADTTVPTLPNNVIYDVQADRQGRVYLLTNKGVARLTRRAPTAGDPSPFDLYNFTTEDGLPSNECNGGAALVDRNGRIWIGTAGGAAVLDPSKERSVPASPLRVERTLVNGNALATSGDTHAQPSWPSIAGTRLPYNRSDVVFESALLSYYKESGTTYRSQLVGLEDIPTAWATEPSRTFSRLPAGDCKSLKDSENGACVLDVERGLVDGIWPRPFQTDTCIGNWHYLKGVPYKTPKTIVDLLVDIVSRNGNLMLNFPLPGSGELDAEELRILDAITRWMAVNGEAIYATRPWKTFGDGPVTRELAAMTGTFSESKRKDFSAQDFRFTTKGSTLYAFVMGWPETEAVIPALGSKGSAVRGSIDHVEMLGHDGKLEWSRDETGLRVRVPSVRPCEHAFALRIRGRDVV